MDDVLVLCACPVCGVPAEITHVRTFGSTAGPLVIGRVLCVNRHIFVMPVERLVVPGLS